MISSACDNVEGVTALTISLAGCMDDSGEGSFGDLVGISSEDGLGGKPGRGLLWHVVGESIAFRFGTRRDQR